MRIKILTTLILLLMAGVTSAQEKFNFLSTNQDLLSAGAGNTDLYEQIAREFHLEYENIGRREAQRILLGNGTSITGGLNNIGFSYRRPFINFGVTVDRSLAPDPSDGKRWIVNDVFTIDIDASRVLGSLRNDGVIDMSDQNLAAFAGVVFKRKIIWSHFASSYEAGLTQHFEKLFLPFKALSLSNISKLPANELVFKEDYISVKAGGLVSAPLYTGVTAMGGVLAKFEKISRVEVISMGNGNLQITSEKSKVATAGASLSIQADFLKILRLTLLSYDFSYSHESSYKIFMNVKQSDPVAFNAQSIVGKEMQTVLKGKEGSLKILAPYIISEEKRISQSSTHRYNFLLLGGQKSSKTQQVEITKDGKIKNFFIHNYEKIKYTENLTSRLFASFIFAITNTDLSATQTAFDSKKVLIEYDSERNLLDKKESLDIGKGNDYEQKLSMTFTSNFKTQKTSGRSGKKYRDRAKFILERFSGVDPIAVAMIESGHLKAPFNVEGKYQVNIEGIRYLNSQTTEAIFGHINGLCNEYPKSGLINFRNLFDHCRRSLQDDYIEYRKDLTHDRVSSDEIDKCESKAKKYSLFPAKKRAYIKNCLADINQLDSSGWVHVPLWQLKNFSTNIVNNAYSKVHFYNLFGVQNTFFFGSFDAVTADNRSFTTNFHEGLFKGLGAIDHYMRMENLRAPASVVVNQ